MIEDEDRAADDGPPPAANDNGNDGVQGRIDDRCGGADDRPPDRPADGAGSVRAFERLKVANDNAPPERRNGGELGTILEWTAQKANTPGAFASGVSVSLVAGVGFEPTTFRL
jgi:hypothetical protein